MSLVPGGQGRTQLRRPARHVRQARQQAPAGCVRFPGRVAAPRVRRVEQARGLRPGQVLRPQIARRSPGATQSPRSPWPRRPNRRRRRLASRPGRTSCGTPRARSPARDVVVAPSYSIPLGMSQMHGQELVAVRPWSRSAPRNMTATRRCQQLRRADRSRPHSSTATVTRSSLPAACTVVCRAPTWSAGARTSNGERDVIGARVTNGPAETRACARRQSHWRAARAAARSRPPRLRARSPSWSWHRLAGNHISRYRPGSRSDINRSQAHAVARG